MYDFENDSPFANGMYDPRDNELDDDYDYCHCPDKHPCADGNGEDELVCITDDIPF